MGGADRWARVAELFDAALDKPSPDRASFVRASSAPADIQDEVLSLLASHDEAGDFLKAGRDPANSSGRPDQPERPDRIGPYRIVKELGRGGMGVVYQAEDTRLHRLVALKLLSASLAGDERQRERLKQEARAAAALTHPGIATVYALDEIDSQLVIVSEYLDGETIRAEIDRGPFPPDRAIVSAVEIARAMAAAHERGIVHRDLKPENILRTTTGTLKILDFGLAQFDGAARDLVSITRLTQAGLVAGTPPYMAPEQLLGRTVDFRADHFAFGVLLYEMSVGRHPFGGRSLPSTIARILAADPDPPPPSDQLPEGIWPLVERCLQKDPAARFASTSDLLRELEKLRDALAAYGSRLTAYGGSAEARNLRTSEPPNFGTPQPGNRGPLELHAVAPGRAEWWWRFHQFAAAFVYWAMVWPVWHVHRGLGRGGLFFFFATLAAVVVSGNLRIHLWFSSRVYPDQLAAQRAEVGRWIRAADCAFVALLVAGGLLLPEDRAGWAALLISVGIGAAVAFLIIEPSTTRAAFGRDRTDRT